MVTDKTAVKQISKEIAELVAQNSLQQTDIQINLIDAESARDGRFLSYTIDYTDFIKKHGVLLAGHLYPELRGIDNRFGIQESTASNFRKELFIHAPLPRPTAI